MLFIGFLCPKVGFPSARRLEEIDLDDAQFAAGLFAAGRLVEVQFAGGGGSDFDDLAEGLAVGGGADLADGVATGGDGMLYGELYVAQRLGRLAFPDGHLLALVRLGDDLQGVAALTPARELQGDERDGSGAAEGVGNPRRAEAAVVAPLA